MSFLDEARTGELWAKVKSALSDKQPKLTGQPGQVVGFGADGSAKAVQGWDNINLLDNWYFPDLVNQRGQTEYTGPIYAIDNWYLTNSVTKAILENKHIKLRCLNPNGAAIFMQRIPGSFLPDGVYTLSALIDNELVSVTERYTPNMSRKVAAFSNGWCVAISFENGNYCPHVRTWLAGSQSVDVDLRAIKLEPGSVQTLAHMEGEIWVLNDPPPDKTLELLKCQRYFQVFSSEALRPTKAVDFRPPMRVDPALGTIEINGVTYYTADANL